MSSSWFSVGPSIVQTASHSRNILKIPCDTCMENLNPNRYWGDEETEIILFDLNARMEGLKPGDSIELDISDTGTVSVLEDLGAASVTGWEDLASTSLYEEDSIASTYGDPDFGDEVVIKITASDDGPPKKRRGRRPKSETAQSPSVRKIKKKKLYEVDQPFQDDEAEKKRKNAIKAKLNRDRIKQENEALKIDIEKVKGENDELRLEVATYKKRVEKLEKDLSRIKKKLSALVSDVEGSP